MELPDVESLTLSQIAQQYPPPGWEKLFEWARPELALIDIHLQGFGPFFPLKRNVFRAFYLCPPSQIKVLIMGQDPYHATDYGRPQANGLAFSTDRGHPVQPSLANIYTELEREYNIEETKSLIAHWTVQRDERFVLLEKSRATFPKEQVDQWVAQIPNKEQLVQLAVKERPVFQRPGHGDLSKWVQEGVLLLNASLTVSPHKAGSHKSIWNGFIAKALFAINEANPECVCLLWGKKAQEAGEKMGQRAIRICASHPSPLQAYTKSRDCPAFIGSGCFKEANQYLVQQGREPIDWILK